MFVVGIRELNVRVVVIYEGKVRDKKGDGVEDGEYAPGKPCLGIECVECFNSPGEQLIACNIRNSVFVRHPCSVCMSPVS